MKDILVLVAGMVLGIYLVFLLVEYGFLTYTVNPPNEKIHITWTFNSKRGK
jgi:hypothetical protein